jgi:SsrA-binding protein
MAQANINVRNKKAFYQYEILDKYEAGIMLLGTEIKSIREGKATLGEGYCYFKDGALYIKNMNISEYSHGNINNHDPLRERKLLLHKRELAKLEASLDKGGSNNTIVPLRLFINNKGLAKLEIALGRGKKLYDKRNSLKERDIKRDIDRLGR